MDTSALFGLFVPGDSHHDKAKKIFSDLQKKAEFWVLNLVIQETATVLSYKVDHKISLLFLEKFSSLGLVCMPIDESLEKEAWRIFKDQTKKGTSFIDCANLAAIEVYRLDGILSFDSFYPKQFRFSR